VAEDRKQSSLDGFWETLTEEQTVEEGLHGFQDRLIALETRLNGHVRAQRRQDANLNARLNAVDAAQRATDARVSELYQELLQHRSTNLEGGGDDK
jgi:hypothetical protein